MFGWHRLEYKFHEIHLLQRKLQDKKTKGLMDTQNNSTIGICVLTNMENRLKEETGAITLCGSSLWPDSNAVVVYLICNTS